MAEDSRNHFLMFDFLKKAFWNLSCPWPDRGVERCVRPLNLELCRAEDLPECRRLLEQNEAHGVPPNHRESYRLALESGRFLTVIAREEGRVVGTFGLQHGYEKDVLLLCYLLVSPECHRNGLGTTMVLSALAMLPEQHDRVSVRISALRTATGFYRRFGFKSFDWEQDAEARQWYMLAELPVSCAVSQRCREVLATAGTRLPRLPYEIPLVPRPAQDGAMP